MRKLLGIICFSAVLTVFTGEALAVNGTCQELKLNLPPIYQSLQARLKQHLWTRDVNVKISAEQDTDAYFAFSQLADRFDKLMDRATRHFNDDDPEAENVCRSYILEANCAAYAIYQRTVIALPGINRAAVEAEGVRRCEGFQKFEATHFPNDNRGR